MNLKNNVSFFYEETKFKIRKAKKIKLWIDKIIKQEKNLLQQVNIIFCSDSYLYEINLQHLQHDTLTDIITFDYSPQKQYIQADLYISIERVKENAKKFKISIFNEILRVIAHGIMHLIGYNDKTNKEKEIMRNKEDQYIKLALLKFS